MSEYIYTIYKHISPNGKAYIGQTKDYTQRVKDHQVKHSPCRLFKKSIDKYGWENF